MEAGQGGNGVTSLELSGLSSYIECVLKHSGSAKPILSNLSCCR